MCCESGRAKEQLLTDRLPRTYAPFLVPNMEEVYHIDINYTLEVDK